MATRVVNLRRESYDVYIGRGSRMGNKYRIGSGYTRESSIEAYRLDFYWRLEHEVGFMEYVESLHGLALGCFCKPLPCHGDVIVAYLDELEKV